MSTSDTYTPKIYPRCEKTLLCCTCIDHVKPGHTYPMSELDRIERALSAKTKRECPKCGMVFLAEGLTAWCSECDPTTPSLIRPASAAPVPKVQFGTDWPKRAVRALETAKGPSIDKARDLLPLTKEGLLIFVGDRGTGKTVMSAWIERERQLAGQKAGIYTKAFNIFEAIKRSWHPQTKEIESDVISRYRRLPFLVIDEAQERSEGEWENRTLVNIIDHRYDACLPTIIIANLKVKDLDSCLGPSIIRRATETGGLVECNWKSYV